MRQVPAAARELSPMRLMVVLWTSIIGGGLAYFIVIGLTHH